MLLTAPPNGDTRAAGPIRKSPGAMSSRWRAPSATPGVRGQRRRFDCAFHGPELRSVELTAAFSDNSLLRAVDASAATWENR
jgi:hypothetical protein